MPARDGHTCLYGDGQRYHFKALEPWVVQAWGWGGRVPQHVARVMLPLRVTGLPMAGVNRGVGMG